MKKISIFCYTLAILFLLGALFPLYYLIFSIGNVLLFLLAIVTALFPTLWKIGKKKRWLKITTSIVYSFGFGVLFLLSVSMLRQAYGKQPPSTGKQTVIVLGAAVRGNQPSRVLRKRLTVAEEYLKQNPDAVCIVSGGQGDDEMYPEAQIMKEYLVARGIDADRITEENQSVNTRQNLRLSQKYIAEDSQGIVIVTDNFHQKRASVTAKTIGLDPVYSLSSTPPIGLLPAYWARDILGIPLTFIEERILKSDKELITRDMVLE